jgi:hypothetical protein
MAAVALVTACFGFPTSTTAATPARSPTPPTSSSSPASAASCSRAHGHAARRRQRAHAHLARAARGLARAARRRADLPVRRVLRPPQRDDGHRTPRSRRAPTAPSGCACSPGRGAAAASSICASPHPAPTVRCDRCPCTRVEGVRAPPRRPLAARTADLHAPRDRHPRPRDPRRAGLCALLRARQAASSARRWARARSSCRPTGCSQA